MLQVANIQPLPFALFNDIQIKDAVGNEYGKPKDVTGEQRMAFTSHADAAFDVCFENIATSGGHYRGSSDLFRSVELDVDIGADARDWSAIQAAEKLKPVEIELRRIEELVGEIVGEMEYLRTREQKLRDTNESTNERVKWFAFATISTLVGLGAWQVVYLRSYFRFVILLVFIVGVVSMDYANVRVVMLQEQASYLEGFLDVVEMVMEGVVFTMKLLEYASSGFEGSICFIRFSYTRPFVVVNISFVCYDTEKLSTFLYNFQF